MEMNSCSQNSSCEELDLQVLVVVGTPIKFWVSGFPGRAKGVGVRSRTPLNPKSASRGPWVCV